MPLPTKAPASLPAGLPLLTPAASTSFGHLAPILRMTYPEQSATRDSSTMSSQSSASMFLPTGAMTCHKSCNLSLKRSSTVELSTLSGAIQGVHEQCAALQVDCLSSRISVVVCAATMQRLFMCTMAASYATVLVTSSPTTLYVLHNASRDLVSMRVCPVADTWLLVRTMLAQGISWPERSFYRDDLVLLYAPEFHCATGTFEQMRMKVLQQSRLTLLNAADDDVRWMQERLDNESSRFATRVQLDESLPSSLLVRREP